jgi:hypothetical protein
MNAEQLVERKLAEETEIGLLEEIFPSTNTSTIDPIQPELGSNPSRRGGKPTINHLIWPGPCLCYQFYYYFIYCHGRRGSSVTVVI